MSIDDEDDKLGPLTKGELEVLRKRFGIDVHLHVKRQKIREKERRAIRKLIRTSVELRCSFCNKLSSEVGGLCQSDNDAEICLQCAKTAIEMLENSTDD